jgi:hypothetical protein
VPALQGAFERGGMPAAQAHRAATAGRIGGIVFNVLLVALYIAVGIAGARGQRWAFWTGLALYGFTGLGVVIVPLRDTGLSTAGLAWTLLNDGLALALFGWMLISCFARWPAADVLSPSSNPPRSGPAIGCHLDGRLGRPDA